LNSFSEKSFGKNTPKLAKVFVSGKKQKMNLKTKLTPRKKSSFVVIKHI